MPACLPHPDTEAAATCSSGLKPLWAACLRFDAYRPACESCALRLRSARRTRLWLVVAGILVVLPVLTLGGLYLVWTYEPPFDYGDRTGEIVSLRRQLKAEPCDQPS